MARLHSVTMSALVTVLLPLVALLFLLPLVAVDATNVDLATLPWPPRDVVGAYKQFLGPFTWASVISPPQLVGSFTFQMGFTGTSFPQSSIVHDPIQGASWTVEVAFPHKDDSVYACTPSHTKDEFNQSFAGKILIAKRTGGCATGVKSTTIAASGAAGMLVMGCEPFAPFNCARKFTKLPDTIDGRIPGMYIQYEDGALIRDYLELKRNYTNQWYSASVSDRSSMQPIDVAYPPVRIKWVASGPVVASERAALVSIIQSFPQDPDVTDGTAGYNKNLNAILNSTVDPCLDHLATVHCENGHIVTLLGESAWQTTPGLLPPAFGAFTQLRVFDISDNTFYGAMPDTMCSLAQIQWFLINSQAVAPGRALPGFTSLPDCLGSMSKVINIQLYLNSLTKLPATMYNMTKLTTVDASFNQLASLPANLSQCISMKSFDVQNNKIQGQLFDIQTWRDMNFFNVAANQLTGDVPPHAFDGLTSLDYVGLDGNAFTGTAPLFINSKAITSIILAGNQFTSLPSSWSTNLPNLVQLQAANNKIVSPLPLLGGMTKLTTIDLSSNHLTCLGVNGPQSDFADIIVEIVGPSLTDLNLNTNKFACDWNKGISVGGGALVNLNLANNQIAGLTWFNSHLQTIDLSNNNLTLGITGFNGFQVQGAYSTVDVALRSISFLNNPRLFANAPSTPLSNQFQLDPTIMQYLGNFLCPTLRWTIYLGATMRVDPQFFFYNQCKCGAGFFGEAPLCEVVPMAAKLLPGKPVTSSGVANFDTLIATSNSLGGSGGGTNASDHSFSDGWYGSNRLTLGVNTAWSIDLSSVVAGSLPICAASSASATSTNQYDTEPILKEGCLPASSGSSRVPSGTGVRTIYLRLQLNSEYFAKGTDVIQVFEGDETLAGSRLFVMHGDELATHPIVAGSTVNSTSISSVWPDPMVGYTRSQPYRAAYGSVLDTFKSSVVITIPVFTLLTSVSYQSRRTSGTGFFATYSYSFECPDDYFYNPETGRCAVKLIHYQPSVAVQGVVYAASALSMVFILAGFAMMAISWNSAVLRAASRGFLVLVLSCLFIMAFGAILYGASPATYLDAGDQTTADALCAGRVWLSALPLVAILAVLLAKTQRLNIIFNQKVLQIQKGVSDFDLLVYVCVLCSLEVVFLGVHSGLPLSRAVQEAGSGSLTQYLVSSCSQESGFTGWLGVQVSFVAVLMLRAAFLTFKTRNTPTRFNEGASIMQALNVLIFFVVLIVPLDLLIQSDPNASIVIQGIGQSLLTMLLTGILFLPKAYYLYLVKDGNRKDIGFDNNTAISKDGSSSVGIVKPTTGSGGNGIKPGPSAAAPHTSSVRKPSTSETTDAAAAANTVARASVSNGFPRAVSAGQRLPVHAHKPSITDIHRPSVNAQPNAASPLPSPQPAANAPEEEPHPSALTVDTTAEEEIVSPQQVELH